MKRWKRTACLAGVMLFALALAARGSWSAAGQGRAGDGTAPELEGTWRTTVAIHGLPGGDPPPMEGVLHTFARGGVVMITVPLAGQSAAQGAWTRLGPRRFGFTALAVLVGAAVAGTVALLRSTRARRARADWSRTAVPPATAQT